MTGKEITKKYVEYGRLLDEALWPQNRGEVANWCHFAAWGTFNVNMQLKFVGPEVADILIPAMNATYDALTAEVERFTSGERATESEVGQAFRLYESAGSMAHPNNLHWSDQGWNKLGVVKVANATLATREQKALQDPLERAAALLPPGLVEQGVVIFPNEQVMVSPQPWLDLDVRLPWILKVMNENIDNPGMHLDPYECKMFGVLPEMV